jgi:hypothetical protein
MPSRKRPRAAIDLPKGVHKVISRGKEYYYFQAGRGTSAEGPRIKIDYKPQTPEFWAALRERRVKVLCRPSTRSTSSSMNTLLR